MRETKRSKANEALGVVAKFVSLGALNRLLYPLQQAVLAASSQKTLRRLEVRLAALCCQCYVLCAVCCAVKVYSCLCGTLDYTSCASHFYLHHHRSCSGT